MLPKDFLALTDRFSFFEDCDGMVSLGIPSIEPEACAVYRKWFDPRPVYFVGPLTPNESFTEDKGFNLQIRELKSTSNSEAEIKTFLDAIHETHGTHSLLYVCQNLMFSF